jgi:hypothetical protein
MEFGRQVSRGGIVIDEAIMFLLPNVRSRGSADADRRGLNIDRSGEKKMEQVMNHDTCVTEQCWPVNFLTPERL